MQYYSIVSVIIKLTKRSSKIKSPPSLLFPREMENKAVGSDGIGIDSMDSFFSSISVFPFSPLFIFSLFPFLAAFVP